MAGIIHRGSPEHNRHLDELKAAAVEAEKAAAVEAEKKVKLPERKTKTENQ